jgi:ADP-ribose pyrophosphatase
MQAWKTKSRQTLLDHSPWLVVEDHSIELPNGELITNWKWIITPDYVNVVAITEEQDFLCFRQTKYAVNGSTLAITGGYIEEDESALAAAQRELLEETGYQANSWQHLGSFNVDGNRGSGVAHLFLAMNSYYVSQTNNDDLEEQNLIKLSRTEIQTALLQGEFKVLAWTTAISLALLHLSQERDDLDYQVTISKDAGSP